MEFVLIGNLGNSFGKFFQLHLCTYCTNAQKTSIDCTQQETLLGVNKLVQYYAVYNCTKIAAEIQ